MSLNFNKKIFNIVFNIYRKIHWSIILIATSLSNSLRLENKFMISYILARDFFSKSSILIKIFKI